MQDKILLKILGKVEGLESDMKELKADVSVLKQDVSVLKQDVSVLKQDVSVLKQDVDVLKKKMDMVMGQTAFLTEYKTVSDKRMDCIEDVLDGAAKSFAPMKKAQ